MKHQQVEVERGRGRGSTAMSMAGKNVKPRTAIAVMEVLSRFTDLAILMLVLLSCCAITVNIFYEISFLSYLNDLQVLLPL